MARTRKLKQNQRKRRIRRILKSILWSVIAACSAWLLLIGGKYWLLHTDVFNVRDIEIRGMHYMNEEDIRKLVTIEPGERIFDVQFDSIRTAIEELAYVSTAAIGPRYPSTVRIDITEKNPVAYLLMGKVLVVDESGSILPKLNNSPVINDLPFISGIIIKKFDYGVPLENEKLDRSAQFLELLRKNMPGIYNMTSEVRLTSTGDLNLMLEKTGMQINFGKDEYDIKMAKLHYFLQHHKQYSPNVQLTRIDLNYKDQIIVKERTS